MKTGLGAWFALWHPRYRTTLVQLLIAGTFASGLVYIQNHLLGMLTQALAGEPAGFHPEGAAALLARLAQGLPFGLPLVVLGLYVASRLASGAIDFWKTYAEGKLTIQTKDDLETEILLHLLRKEDSFFNRHSPVETVNRLAVDLFRISARRPNLMKIAWSSLLLLGNLVFFFQKDWRLALVALVACLAGALWILRTTQPVKAMDNQYAQQDDHIKSRFEDLLRTAPEIQTGALYEKIGRSFRQLLGSRSTTFLKFVQLNGSLRLGSLISNVLAFVAMIFAVLYLRHRGVTDAAVILIPVVVARLPEIFSEASDLVFLRLDFQMARVSMDRLLKYESQLAEDTSTPSPLAGEQAEPLRFANTTYRYSNPDGTQQGGVVDVSTDFAPGCWTAIVGGAGSGKSTLLKLLIGRLPPQAGAVLYGATPLAGISPSRRAGLFSLMPQSIALLNTTIRQNLLFGRPQTDGTLSETDLDVVERAGLGRVCRLKALDLVGGPDIARDTVAPRIGELRSRLRARLQTECQATVQPFETGHADRTHWVLECLLGGRCDRKRVVSLLGDRKNRRRLRPVTETVRCPDLLELGRSVLRENRHLLSISNFHVYTQLSQFPLDEPLWRLRTTCLELVDDPRLSVKETVALCVVGLTSSLAELAAAERATTLCQPETRQSFAEVLAVLRPLLGDAWRPFTATEVHPHLTWRENLVFGTVEVSNHRSGQLLDQTILEFLRQEGLQEWCTRLGLEFEIGRLGGNLSGGQGQLVALGRSLLRRTPVLVLDEPTSALDPASRATVAALLREWKAQRIVITISHDVAFIRDADEIKLIDAGRLVASGTFQELQTGSEVFRRVLTRQ